MKEANNCAKIIPYMTRTYHTNLQARITHIIWQMSPTCDTPNARFPAPFRVFLCRWLSSGLMNIFVGLFTTNWVKIIMLCGWRTVDPILVMWLRMSKSREYFQRICNTVQETHNNKSKMDFSPPFVCTMLYSDSILYAIFAFVVCISFSLSLFEWIFHSSSSLPNWIGIILLFHLFPLAWKRCGTNIHLHHNTYVHSELRDTLWWKATTDLFLPGKRENKGE